MQLFKKNSLTPENTGIQYRSFDEFLQLIGISKQYLADISDKSERTIRRYCRDNNAPQIMYLVAYCAAGYLLSDAWAGWRVHNDGIVHHRATSCNHDSIKPSMLMDMSLYYGYKRSLELKCNDLTRENNLLREKLLIIDYKRLVPENVIPFNHTVSYEQISKQIKGI